MDAHEGRTGAWNVKNEYSFHLTHYDPKARYTLVAQLNVSTSRAKRKTRTTQATSTGNGCGRGEIVSRFADQPRRGRCQGVPASLLFGSI